MADADTKKVVKGLFNAATTIRQPEAPATPTDAPAIVEIEANDNGATIDEASGALIIETEDGGVVIDFDPRPDRKDADDPNDFNANLAEIVDEGELGRISGDLLRGIQQDDMSRREWLETRAQGIRILGLTIEAPRSSIDTTTALEGMSNIRHPLLLEATLRFQANARGELLPASGPVKVADKLTEGGASDELAEQLEEGMNYYLTVCAPEYYPDTDRALFYTGFGGCSFKKVYNCPLRERPVSESIDAKDIIVSNAATDMRNSGRVTHQITMRPSVLRRMQLVGAYRDISIPTPPGLQPNPVEQEIADVQGINPISQLTEDREHIIYECYCELDIRGFEDKDGKGPTGLPLPYRVVLEKDSMQVLEIRRNWREEDDSKTARVCFVKYPFVPGLGFYDIGLIHILGNTANALTAAWRELLDAGMFANFPGFLYKKSAGRQNTNEFRVPPGGGQGLDVDTERLADAVMPLPYKDVSVAFSTFVEHIAETGQRVGGTADVQVAEGRQDAPVGTTLAMIEQATKIEGAVHKRLHAAQAEEFGLLKECFRENPTAFVKAMQQRGATDWNEENFLMALEDASLVPQADPNTPSHMHRLMKAMALKQLQAASPGLYDPRQIDMRVLHMLGVDNPEQLFAPPVPGGIPPELQVEMAKLQDSAAKRQDSQQNRQHQMTMEATKANNAMQKQQMVDANETLQHQIALHTQDQESRDQELERRQEAEQLAHQMELERLEGKNALAVEKQKGQNEAVKGKYAVAAAKAKPKPKPAAKSGAKK